MNAWTYLGRLVFERTFSCEKIEKSAWLGPIVARWAGREYEPCPKQE